MNISRRLLNDSPSCETDLRRGTAAERAQWIERYRQSGQCQRAFAQTHGLRLSQLRYWIYNPSRPKADGVRSAPRMQEVTLNGWPSQQPWSAEITLPAGPTIRLNTALARELIAPLLQTRD
jgi:transposase-like protein